MKNYSNLHKKSEEQKFSIFSQFGDKKKGKTIYREKKHWL
jgi:hypothetical protein